MHAEITVHSLIKVEQASVSPMIDGNPKTWWATSVGDLLFNPVDVDILFPKPHAIDTLVIRTSAFKGQLRLKDFDLYAGLDDAWDGAHPLAQIRNNSDMEIHVRFQAVWADQLRIRLLGTHRTDNALAHIAELSVHSAADGPHRKVETSEFPLSPAEVGHDPDAIRSLIRSLRLKDDKYTHRSLSFLETRLQLIEESQKYESVLERISADTERYRRLDAPEWALAQRDSMARLRNWAYYWIDHQQPDGQFGAHYGDDVELVCGWPVLVLAQDDTKIRRSLELLADGVWKSRPFLERFGYDHLTDVEHAAENTSYSQPRMVVMDNANPKWSERCRRTVATMAEHFLSRNKQDRLQFRSDYFGFDPQTLQPVTREQDRPFDIAESSKALKPAMYAVWATGNEQCQQIMLDYGRTWVEAAKATDGPERIAGLLPQKIRWPSGQAVSTHDGLFSMRATLFHLIGCYHLTGEDRYLEPIRALLEKSLLEWSVKGVPSAGTLSEVLDTDHVGMLGQLALVAIQYRQATGDTRFDDHLARWASRIRDTLVDGVKSYVYLNRNNDRLWYVDRPLTVGAYLESRCSVGSQLYLGWMVTGDENYLAKLGWNLSSCLNDKWGAFTYWFYDKSELRVTSNDHLAHKIQNSESALSLMYTGGSAPIEAVWPRFGVTWKDTGENFCALVRQFDSTGLKVHLYNFDASTRTITANLWELAPGIYEAVVGPDAAQNGHPDNTEWRKTFEVNSQGNLRKPTPVQFALPARTLTVLTIHRPE